MERENRGVVTVCSGTVGMLDQASPGQAVVMLVSPCIAIISWTMLEPHGMDSGALPPRR